MMKENRKTAEEMTNSMMMWKRRKIQRTESQYSRLLPKRIPKTWENSKGTPSRSAEMAEVAIGTEETNAFLNMKRKAEAMKQKSLTGAVQRTRTAEADR